MKYYYALSPALIGVSMVLISQVALGLSAQEVEQIGKEITVRIVDAQNPSIAGSGVIIKRAGNTYKINPNYAEAYGNLGKVRYKLKDLQGVIADFDQALRINPNFAEAYYDQAIVRFDLRDFQGAIVNYNQALRIKPNYSNAYNNRGNARRKLGDSQGAIDDYNQALQINPKNANAYLNRGCIHFMQPNY